MIEDVKIDEYDIKITRVTCIFKVIFEYTFQYLYARVFYKYVHINTVYINSPVNIWSLTLIRIATEGWNISKFKLSEVHMTLMKN
jgi:hypothetical protein